MMSLAPVSTLFFLIILFLHNQSAVSTDNSDKKTAYEILQSYNFPVGLLPKGFTKYELDERTGQFHAYRDGSCSFSLEGSYQLKYKSTISGYISENRLTRLTGVSVKVLFLWLNIVEVVRNGDDIQFSVGIASASFSIDNFYVCPQCGCGLDCVNGQLSALSLMWQDIDGDLVEFGPSVDSTSYTCIQNENGGCVLDMLGGDIADLGLKPSKLMH